MKRSARSSGWLVVTSCIASCCLFLSAAATEAATDGTATAPAAHTFFVSAAGNDAADGLAPAPTAATGSGPFASLQRARDAIRQLSAAGKLTGTVEVRVAAGQYELAAPLQLVKKDSGKPEAPVVYRAEGGEVLLSAGRRLASCIVTEGGIHACDLSRVRPKLIGSIGLDSRTGDALPPFELFMAGERLQLARWPNAGFSTDTGYSWAYLLPTKAGLRDEFSYSPQPAKAWGSMTGAVVHIWPGNDWFDQYIKLRSVDPARNRMRLTSTTSYPIEAGRRFAVLNVREELDTPGEWYFDAANSRVELLAPVGTDGIVPIVSALDTAIDLTHVSHVQFEGFTVEHSRKTGITIHGGSRVRLHKCTVRNVGGFGIEIKGGERHEITASEIHDTGYGGVVLNGGERKTLTAAGHLVADSAIHDTGRIIRVGRAGIALEGVGNVARSNRIYRTPGMGVLINGNEHLLEFNDIHNACEESSDCGAVYTGRDWTFHGNVIRHNRIHDIYGYGRSRVDPITGVLEYSLPHGARGVYLDDAVSGLSVVGNVFYNIPYMSIQLGGGRDNIIDSNLFLTRGYAVWMDARWPGFPWDTTMAARLRAVPYDGPVWRERYPRLAAPMANPSWPEGNRITRNVVIGHGPGTGATAPFKYAVAPNGTVIDHNLVWNPTGDVKVDYRLLATGEGKVATWEEWRQLGFDQASLSVDPRLSKQNGDHHIPAESPALSLGFRPIPYQQMARSGVSPTNEWAASATRVFRFPLKAE